VKHSGNREVVKAELGARARDCVSWNPNGGVLLCRNSPPVIYTNGSRSTSILGIDAFMLVSFSNKLSLQTIMKRIHDAYCSQES
jgi:hypothetical protein